MDIRLFRTDPDQVRESQRRRYRDPAVVDEVIALDEEWRKGNPLFLSMSFFCLALILSHF